MTLTYIISITGTFIFSIAAMIAGTRKKLDLFGLGFIGFVSALGGGTVRDILLGNYPLTWVTDKNYALAVILGLMVMVAWGEKIVKLKKVLFYSDMIGVAIATILGLQKSLAFGLPNTVAIIFGVVSAIMGGVLRDVLCNQIPLIFKRELYASACILGGVVYVVLLYLKLPVELVFVLSIITIITIRLVALKYRITLPSPTVSE